MHNEHALDALPPVGQICIFPVYLNREYLAGTWLLNISKVFTLSYPCSFLRFLQYADA
jgi:hypothetical protein